nr:MAG TPA: hypothetical protein [Caudoviricetes sp.]
MSLRSTVFLLNLYIYCRLCIKFVHRLRDGE